MDERDIDDLMRGFTAKVKGKKRAGRHLRTVAIVDDVIARVCRDVDAEYKHGPVRILVKDGKPVPQD